MKLESNSLVPLYQQVINDIRAGIDDGSYAVGQKIPSESELSELYNVSRITIRRAIEELSADGYLTKKQGKGTYVTSRKLQTKITQLGRLTTFAAICEDAGRVPGAQTIDCARVEATPDVAKSLGVPRGSELFRLRRVRTANGIPTMYEVTFFAVEEFSYLENEDFNNVTIYDVLERHGARKAVHAKDALIEVVPASTEIADALSVPIGEPMLSEIAVVVDEDDMPVFACALQMVGRLFALRID